MAAKKTTARSPARKRGAPAGIVRFKVGFPAGFREALRRRYGDDWHLSLQILDGDDGDGDDGDGDDGNAGSGARKVSSKAAKRPATKRASKSAAKRGARR